MAILTLPHCFTRVSHVVLYDAVLTMLFTAVWSGFRFITVARQWVIDIMVVSAAAQDGIFYWKVHLPDYRYLWPTHCVLYSVTTITQ